MKRWGIVWIVVVCAVAVSGCTGSPAGPSKAVQTYVVTGRITDENETPIAGVRVAYSGNVSGSVITDANGSFNLVGLQGQTVITPNDDGWSFSPESATVTNQSESLIFIGRSKAEGTEPKGLLPPVVTEWRHAGGSPEIVHLAVLASDRSGDVEEVIRYQLFKSNEPQGPFELVDESDKDGFPLRTGAMEVGQQYFYKLRSVTKDGRLSSLSDETYLVKVLSEDVVIGPIGQIETLRPVFEWTQRFNYARYRIVLDGVDFIPGVIGWPGRYTIDFTRSAHHNLEWFSDLEPGKWRWNIIMMDYSDLLDLTVIVSDYAYFEIKADTP